MYQICIHKHRFIYYVGLVDSTRENATSLQLCTPRSAAIPRHTIAFSTRGLNIGTI